MRREGQRMGKEPLNYTKHKGVARHEEGGKCTISVWLTISDQYKDKFKRNQRQRRTGKRKFKHNTTANTNTNTKTNTKPKYDKTRPLSLKGAS